MGYRRVLLFYGLMVALQGCLASPGRQVPARDRDIQRATPPREKIGAGRFSERKLRVFPRILPLLFIFPVSTCIHELFSIECDFCMNETVTPSFFCRIKNSVRDCSGEIVFGMSDGVVSIFGLVAGMVVGAQSGNVILLAGATAAIAATVSMMAGVFLDLESERDAARVEAKERAAKIKSDPDGAVNQLITDLQGTGLSSTSLDAIREDMKKDPLAIQKFEDAVAGEEETSAQKTSPVIHACWMGVADFIAAMTPVVPFIFLPLEQAKIVFIFSTAFLLILLGIGRAILGERPMLRTVLETCAIAAAAAVAGALVGLLVSS
jgi:VIT1/CCC1 family predicted Fe2+/Mn2+ transporter